MKERLESALHQLRLSGERPAPPDGLALAELAAEHRSEGYFREARWRSSKRRRARRVALASAL